VGLDRISVTLDTLGPSELVLDPFKALTNIPSQIISGTKDRDTSIWLNHKNIIPIDSLTEWSADILLKEGKNLLSWTSKDELGNESMPVQITIELDTIAPDRPKIDSVVSPTSFKTLTITGTRSMDTSKVLIFSAEAMIDAIGYPTAVTWGCEVTLKEGDNSITVFGQDSAGNQVMGDKVSIKLDTAPPLFDVVYPLDGSYINGREME
jgi:hypothetical protein